MSRWGAGVWWGGGLVLAALVLIGWAAGVLATQTARPERITVVDAARRIGAGEELEHVRLVDLELDCHSPKAVRSVAWVRGGSVDQPRDDVEVVTRYDPNRSCRAIAEEATGDVRHARPELAKGVGSTAGIVLELQRHESLAWVFVLALALVIAGGLGVRSARPTRQPPTQPRATEAEPDDGGDPFRSTADDDMLLKRPLRPSASWFRREHRNALLNATALIACALGGLTWAIAFGIEAVRVHRVWSEGESPEQVIEITGEERARGFIFRTTSLNATYIDREGRRHSGHTWFLSMSMALDEETSLALRYDPRDPDQFVLSCEVDRFFGRVALTAFGIGVLLTIGVWGSREARRRLRALAEVREVIHAGGREVVLHVAEERPVIAEDNHVVAIRYVLELPDGSAIERLRSAARPPYLLDVATRRVLGVQHPQRPELLVVLDPDLGPLDVEPAEVERVRARYQARKRARNDA